MPGFQVGPLGSGPSGDIKPFYTYTWQIQNLFGDSGQNGPLVFSRDATFPSFEPKREEFESASLVYKYAAQAKWSDVRITFYDIPSGGQKLATILEKWRERVWTPDNGIGLADDYKKESVLDVFNMDQSVEYSWRLIGSWPAVIREGDLTYTSSDAKTVEVIVAYDWAELQ